MSKTKLWVNFRNLDALAEIIVKVRYILSVRKY